jgi:glycine cleavage system protein P-like pyridoxal-binding family
MLSAASGFDDVTVQRASKMAQGTLKTLHELGQIACELSGLESVSLAALSAEQAEFACLSMILKHHQRQRQARQRLLVCGESPLLEKQAQEMGLEIFSVALADLPNALNDQVAAVVFTASTMMPDALPSIELIRVIKEQGILLHLSAAQRYLVAHETLREFDSLTLDLSLLCEVDAPCLAVLAGATLSSTLPVPRVVQQDGAFEWQGLQQHPLSIGHLNNSAGNVSALLQCWVKIHLLGLDNLQQQAQKSVAAGCYLSARLAEAGFGSAASQLDSDRAAGCYRMMLKDDAAAIDIVKQCMSQALTQGVRIDSHPCASAGFFEISIGRLHYLSRSQLDELVQGIAQNLSAYRKHQE